jgi:hypothetical protein
MYAAREDLRGECRAEVIRAKDRARFAARNPRAADEVRRRKAEMIRLMLIWLDDPALFPVWSAARRAREPVRPQTCPDAQP